ncbi:MAG: glycosyltransferase family 2 protein [Flavobacteriaceae bacterium]|nr:glycosyltransferase family 2 protein [Flavobacteriaceae bacterium]
MKTSVIISTYNAPEWLEKVLWSYAGQTESSFELIIADDGSGEETAKLIASFKAQANFPVIHVWQEDEGFQKSKILNKAILACRTDYIIMSDGDCIVRKDFVAKHLKKRKKSRFLSGGYYKLPMSVSKLISKEDIESGRCFELKWLLKNGLGTSFKNNKLNADGIKEEFLNSFTTSKATWNGHNASGWREDILAVNGFDERMQYGGQDREMGERLKNLGIKGKQIRYSAICLHLDHERAYKTKASIKLNKKIRKYTRNKHIKVTPYGIRKFEPLDAIRPEEASVDSCTT